MLIIRQINSGKMAHHLKHSNADRLVRFGFFVMALTVCLTGKSVTQIKPSMKINLNVLPSVNISRMSGDLQNLFAEDIGHLNELASAKTGGEDPVSLDFGFSISAYENITVLLSFTRPELSEKNSHSVNPMRFVCGYLNDGTTYFKRAIITEKNFMQFRLRNNNLLKRSMIHSDPLFVAYAFFLVSHGTSALKKGDPLPVSIITLEFM
jgi:hypothetical protein